MAVKNYGIFDKWLNSEQQNVVDVKSTDGVINSVKVNGQEYGGGGSSDFSTATLTLTRGESNDGRLYVPNLTASPLGTSLFPFINDREGTNTHEIVVYSGGTVLIYDGTNTVTIDGNIQDLGNGSYLITGDGTITLS